jgi:hypothetical protein
MRSILRLALATALLAALTPALAAAGEHRIGFGYHYWETLDEIDLDELDEIDESGSSAVFSYQYLMTPYFRFEVDVEYFEDGFGGSLDEAYAPQVYLLFGRFIYAGVGAGVTNSDGFPSGDEWSDPWYQGRIGLELLALPRLHLDVNANYRANTFEALEEYDTDSFTLGASLRLSLN